MPRSPIANSSSPIPKRNFQVFSALDFLAEVTQHIPDKGERLVRYFGWYSHRQRGIRAKGSGSFSCRHQTDDSPENDNGKKMCLTPSGDAARDVRIDRSALDAEASAGPGPRPGSVSTWAMLIKRMYEVDPLECPHCGGQMKIISFIERCQADVIERILRHVGLWEGALRTLATARAPPATHTARAGELTLVLDGDFLDESLQAEPSPPGELQLVLDPEFL